MHSFIDQVQPLLPQLKRRALKFTRNPADAEDLVQEALTRAWVAWPSYRDQGKMSGWLMTIMRNAYINDYRKGKRRPDLVSFERNVDGVGRNLEWEPEAGGFTVEEQVLAKETESLLADVVEELPEHFREAYLLREGLGLSYREMAERMGTPKGTVMSRLHRARQQVNEQMAELLKVS